ncbi:hypothetical protein [Desulfogranum mediterraneum]|nr:hypothetical protein [Desulfogranum mediterraneum]
MATGAGLNRDTVPQACGPEMNHLRLDLVWLAERPAQLAFLRR